MFIVAAGFLAFLSFIGFAVLFAGGAWFLVSSILALQRTKVWLYEQLSLSFILVMFGSGIGYPSYVGVNFTMAKIDYERAEQQLLNEGWTRITPYCDTNWEHPQPFIMLRDSSKRVIKRSMTESQYQSFCGDYRE